MIQNIRIMPCNRYFCKCVEYLNFSKSKDLNKYKHCFITANNNSKYEYNKRNNKYLNKNSIVK